MTAPKLKCANKYFVQNKLAVGSVTPSKKNDHITALRATFSANPASGEQNIAQDEDDDDMEE